MKRLLIDNIGLKLTAVLFAVILWLIVVNVNNPVRTDQYTVPVTLQNTETVTDAGMIYEVLDDTDTVTVTVSAPRLVLQEMEASDLTVVADFNNITQMNTVPLQVSAKKNAKNIELMSLSHNNLIVELEEAKSKEFPVTLETTGNPAEGYVVGDTSVTPNLVTVTGPARLVDEIHKLVVTVSVDNRNATAKTAGTIQAVNKDGSRIDDKRLVVSQQEVMTTVNFLKTKNVDLRFATVGQCAEGYYLEDIVSDPTTITIAGESASIESVGTIEIPDTELNIEGASEDVVREIDVSGYLPENVRIAEGSSATVKATAKIRQLEQRQFVIPADNINLMNTPENMRASFGEVSEVIVVLTGTADNLDRVNADTLQVSVDLTGLSEGMHRVDLDVVTPENVRVIGNTWVDVTLESTLLGEPDM